MPNFIEVMGGILPGKLISSKPPASDTALTLILRGVRRIPRDDTSVLLFPAIVNYIKIMSIVST